MRFNRPQALTSRAIGIPQDLFPHTARFSTEEDYNTRLEHFIHLM